MRFAGLRQEIGSKYKGKNHQKIAEKCLQLGEEWTRIVSGDWSSFDRFRTPAGADPKEHKKTLKQECSQYIKDNLDPDEVKVFVPIWVLPFMFQVFLGVIVNWITRKLIDNLFENQDEENEN